MTYATLEQRRDARETVSHPGKFEGESPMTPILWEMVLDGSADDECGDSCDGPAYVARIGRWIVSESPSGFVSAYRHDSVTEAEAAYQAFADEFYSESDEG